MDYDKINLTQVPSPCYVIDSDILENNLKKFKTNCNILGIKPLLSIKGFPLVSILRNMKPYICGISASSIFEAQLGKHLGKEIHIHAPAYKKDELKNILNQCDYVTFNSFSQWQMCKNILNNHSKRPNIGLRINPEYSEINIEKYNPCIPYSRFGVTQKDLGKYDITGINGFHLHAMCDNDAETFARIVNILINKFGMYLPRLSWINLGGGQRLADNNYSTSLLQKSIAKLITEFKLNVYVEPCEAIVTECGFLVSTVLDIVNNQKQTAILDISATCHMPDVLDMPYRPDIVFPFESDTGKYSYLLAGISCLAGDIIGEYRFNFPLKVGDKIIFSEMGAYTFAKENYFNGINHPTIALYSKSQGLHIIKQFSYKDYETKYL